MKKKERQRQNAIEMKPIELITSVKLYNRKEKRQNETFNGKY